MQSNFDEELLVGLRVDPNDEQPVLHQVLRIAVYDEYQAYETYKKIIQKFGTKQPFANIMEAEIRHFEALAPLLQKYNVPMPINDWEGKIEAPNSLLEASELGVAAEIDNIKMYDNLIGYSKEYPDILDMLYKLQAASYNNHLPAFRQSVVNHSNSFAGINDISDPTYDGTNAQEQMMRKMNEINDMAAKFASGQMSQEDMMKLLSNTNLSFVGGTLLGAIATVLMTQMQQDKESDQDLKEE